jgi:hypothetical protein
MGQINFPHPAFSNAKIIQEEVPRSLQPVSYSQILVAVHFRPELPT